MSFFSKLTTPVRRGEKNFERGRSAELRGDFAKAKEYFATATEAFDAHFSDENKKTPKPSQLVMAGICYTRLGRNDDALRVLDARISLKEIPDAFLHAGYAAAKLRHVGKTIEYWENYPQWYEQRIMHDTLKEQLTRLHSEGTEALQSACEAVAEAVRQQDKYNESQKRMKRGNQEYPPGRGY